MRALYQLLEEEAREALGVAKSSTPGKIEEAVRAPPSEVALKAGITQDSAADHKMVKEMGVKNLSSRSR